LFASVNGFISQFALESARAHGNLTARSSLPAVVVLFGSL